MSSRLSTFAAALFLAAFAAPADPAAAVGVSPAHGFAPRSVVVKFTGGRSAQQLRLPRRVGVRRAVAALRRSPRVAYAAPDFIASASRFPPDDTGALRPSRGAVGGWTQRQWNFLPWQPQPGGEPYSLGGIDALGAWRNLSAVRRPGAAGVTVAVLDTGIAYRGPVKRNAAATAGFRRSPDFRPRQFVAGYNFVAGNRLPVDVNGHGTHVAGTIAEATDNLVGLTGLAYNAKLMPVQVLNSQGRGRASKIAAGIRFAVENGADVINMSFNFSCGKPVPGVAEAVREAHRAGVVVVASVGNLGSESCVSPPATLPGVIGVGGTTQGGCLGEYSLAGRSVDLLAPGGGMPAPGCRSLLSAPIYQVTLRSHGSEQFGLPPNYVGTSMAAAHVSGVAALVLAAGVIRTRVPASVPAQVLRRLERSARDLGLPRVQQGAGLIDAAAATARSEAPARSR
jgi:serine protease